MAIEKVNGQDVLDTEAAKALTRAGFYTTPKGLRYRV
jgi:ATP-dependent Lhr-like helicase